MRTLHPSKSPPQDLQTLLGLVEIGAHLIFCTADKMAYQKGWQLRRNAKRPAAVCKHVESGGLMGLVPGSLSLVIFDADEGDPVQLLRDFPPLVAIPTSKPGRLHLVYTVRDTQPWRPQDYWYERSFGQIRSEGGFVYLHNPRMLLDAVQGRAGDHPPPSGQKLVIGSEARKMAVVAGLVKARKKPERRAGCRGQSKTTSRPKSTAADVGRSRDSTKASFLFDAVRKWAYRHVRAARETATFEAWLLRVLEWAEAENEGFVEPLPGRDVVDVAHSVAKWTWREYAGARSSSPEFAVLQRRRGLRGWYGDGSNRALSWLWLRNMSIQRDKAKAWKTKALSAKYGLSTRRIRLIVKMALGPCPE